MALSPGSGSTMEETVMGRPVRRFIGVVLLALFVISAPVAPAVAGGARSTDPPGTPPRLILGDAATHDPALARSGPDWYVFSTGDPAVGGGAVQLRSSPDGRQWTYRGTVTPAIPDWVKAAVP